MTVYGLFDEYVTQRINRTAMLQKLALRICPRNLYRVAETYMRERSENVCYMSCVDKEATSTKYVQGSKAGPTCWNQPPETPQTLPSVTFLP